MPKRKTRKPKIVTARGTGLTKAIKPPVHLDVKGKKHWREMLGLLVEKNVVDQIDTGTFTAMCEAYSEFVRAVDLLKKERKKKGNYGMMSLTSKGNWIQHPLLGVKNQAAERYLKFAAQFGMTPAARAKIAENQISAATKLQKYM